MTIGAAVNVRMGASPPSRFEVAEVDPEEPVPRNRGENEASRAMMDVWILG
jgi:hypothetical protein